MGCGKQFTPHPKTKNPKYCSRLCFNKSTKTKPWKKCKYCSKKIKPHPSSGHSKVYCDRKCAAEGRRTRPATPCAFCGKIMLFGHSQATQKYCSKQCSDKAQDQKVALVCPTCNIQFKVSPSFADRGQKYCSIKCVPTFPIGKFKYKLANGIRTNIEAIMEKALEKLKLDFKWEHKIGRYWIDFYLPNFNIAIECDEPYWHDAERDNARDKYLIDNFNVKVLRFTTTEIKNEIEKQLIECLYLD